MKAGNILMLITVLMVLAGAGSGCAPQVRTGYTPLLGERGALYLYLQPLPQEMLPLTFTISEVSVISERGDTIPLLEKEQLVMGRELYAIQKRLLSATLPPGRYKGVELVISRATVATSEGDTDLLPPSAPVRLPLEFTVMRGKALALFLGISPEYLVGDGIKFTPHFVLEKPHLHPKNYLGFISNSTENLVSVFNKRTMEIVQVISTGIAPKDMALDQGRGLVYVALAGDDAIEIISVDTMKIHGRIKLRFGDEPVEIGLSADGETLVSANYGSGTISIIDTRSQSERVRLSMEPDPVWVATEPSGSRAFVLHGLSNTVSVIDLSKRELRSSFPTDEAPFRGAVSRDGDTLYLVSRFSPDLQMMDTASRRAAGTIFIGSNPLSILADPRSELVYVGRREEVVVVDPSAGIYIDSFPVEGKPASMAIDGEENMLMVLSPVLNSLFKYNLVNKKERGRVVAEEGAYALVVMGEL